MDLDLVPPALPAFGGREYFSVDGVNYLLERPDPSDRWHLKADGDVRGYLQPVVGGWAFVWADLTEGQRGSDWRGVIATVV